jgi:DNA-binding transcriptional ArsR family regulator
MVKSHRLDLTFSALADPTRRHILADVARGERTVGHLTGQFDMSFVAVWKHVCILRDAGLITVSAGRPRRCNLAPSGMNSAARWMAKHGAFWTAELEQIGRFLHSTKEGKSTNDS